MVRITYRWKTILSLILKRGWVSIDDVRQIIPNKKYARRVLRNLIRLGFVKQTQCQMPFQSKGPGLNFYAIRKSAERFFDSSIRELKIPTSTHLYHSYIINAVITGFECLSKEHGFSVKYAAEKELRNICNDFAKSEFSSEKTGIPDFALLLQTGDRERLFLGEVDAQTETISNESQSSDTIANKFERIKNSCNQGLLNELSKRFVTKLDAFSYLHITSGDESRLNKIIQSANKANVPFPVFVTAFSSIRPIEMSYEKLIERVWVSINNETVSILEEI